MMPELLLELLSEEIPASLQERALGNLKKLVTDTLDEKGLGYGNTEGMITPRRIALAIDDISDFQKDVIEERRGPRVDSPEKATQGFLKSVGLNISQVEKRKTPKGEFFYAVITHKGRPTVELFKEIFPIILTKMSWSKSMRWGTNKIRWVRPLRSILCIFDGDVVPFSFGSIKSSNITYGHRFHSPNPFTVKGYSDYYKKLKSSLVLVSPRERYELIERKARALATKKNLSIVVDPKLINEIVGLVEWPVILIGKIDESFMELPPEVLQISIQTHQKYIALKKKNGELAAHFIIVANTQPIDGGKSIIAGNERVLRARLSDAQFFFTQDSKHALKDFSSKLSRVVFHAKLGTMDKKASRIQTLAEQIARDIDGTNLSIVGDAARLCKADLVTSIVGEFPELQGVMGSYFAEADGYAEDVSAAIRQHYSPLGPNDICPTRPNSIVVALADKIDTLVGFWLIGEKPTGSTDPFGLRRAALGVIRLIMENGLQNGLSNFLSKGTQAYIDQGLVGDREQVQIDVLAFLVERLKIYLRRQGIRHDLISATFVDATEDRLNQLLERTNALKSFLDTASGASLLVAYKRASNIVTIEEKRDSCTYDKEPSLELFTMSEERNLYCGLGRVFTETAEALEINDFSKAVNSLSALNLPIDRFFDSVTVNVSDSILRENRLRLLSNIRKTFDYVADFSQIES